MASAPKRRSHSSDALAAWRIVPTAGAHRLHDATVEYIGSLLVAIVAARREEEEPQWLRLPDDHTTPDGMPLDLDLDTVMALGDALFTLRCERHLTPTVKH